MTRDQLIADILANAIGGALTAAVVFIATWVHGRHLRKTADRSTRVSLVTELGLLRIDLERLASYPTDGHEIWHRLAIVSSVIQANPGLIGESSIHALLRQAEVAVSSVLAIVRQLRDEGAGLSQAMRGNEEAREELEKRLGPALADAIQRVTELRIQFSAES